MASQNDTSPAQAGDARRVLLHVVSPSEEAKRLTFTDTPLSLTVAEVKLKIHDVVPSRPTPERQRLIYQGRPLTVPTATLASVFGHEASLASDSFTLHLVLPPAGDRTEPNSTAGTLANGTPAGAMQTGVETFPPSQAAARGDVSHASGPVPGMASHPAPQILEHGANVGAGEQPEQNAGLHAGQPQAAQRGHIHIGGHAFPAGVTTGFNPFPQHPPNLPGVGNPFPMNEQMRRLIESHRQRHEDMQRNVTGQNNSVDPTQDSPNVNQSRPEDATSGQYNPSASAGLGHGSGQQNNGTTIVQEGHGPNGQWRVVVNQTTIPFVRPQAQGTAPDPQSSGNAQTSTHAAPSHSVQAFAPPIPPFPMRFNPSAPFQNFLRPPMPQPQSSFPPMVYLLSSPSGYQAVLLPPGASPPSNLAPLSSLHQQNYNPIGTNEDEATPDLPAENDPAPAEQGAQPAARQDEAVDIFRIVFPLGGHLWLLIRLLGFVYLITGGATWTRTILLSSLALVVFVAQAGWLTPIYRQVAEPLRRHLEGVVRIDQPAARAQAQEARPQDQLAQQQPGQAAAPTAREGAGPGVTPEQLAARLIREREDRDPSIIRSTIRRFERSLALFIASLVPGVGEGHVQAQQEAEIARQRAEQEREVEERRRAEEAERSNTEQAAEASGEAPPGLKRESSPAAHEEEREPLLAGAI